MKLPLDCRTAWFTGEGGADGKGTHRLTLWRESRFFWKGVDPEALALSYLDAPDMPFCQFIGLNPSTATDTKDDPTIRRCIAFARSWGFKALCMTNAYAYRATEPAAMFAARDKGVDIVGTFNDDVLRQTAQGAGMIVAAWGGNIEPARQAAIVGMLPKLHALAVNSDHTPKHPLYIKGDTKPFPFGLPATGNRTAAAARILPAGTRQPRKRP